MAAGSVDVVGNASNVVSFNSAISACEKGEQRQQAQVMRSELQNGLLEPTFFSFNAAIGACAKGQHWQQALGMLAEPSRAHEGHI